MLNPNARKDVEQFKERARAEMGDDPWDWMLQRDGSWDSNWAKKMRPLVIALAHAQNENRMEPPAFTLEEGFGLVAYYSGSKSLNDALTETTNQEIADFRGMDGAITKVAPQLRQSAAQTQMNLVLSRYSTPELSVTGSIIRGPDSFTKYTETLISVNIKLGTTEEIVVNLAHEIAHIKQRMDISKQPNSPRDWKLFLGNHLQHIYDPDIEGPHHAAYRRNVLERDADLFAIQIADAIDPVRYQAAKASQLLSD